jgi:hypothetical protein
MKSLLFLLFSCTAGVVKVPEDTEQPDTSKPSKDTSDTGKVEDTADTGGSADSGESADTSGSSDTSDTGACDTCTGVLSVSATEIVLQADGAPVEEPETVDIYGWTTGLTLSCSSSLAHLSWELGTIDTRDTGYTTLSFSVAGDFDGYESGVCVLTSDYGESFVLSVTLERCPTCTGITSCADDNLILVTYWSTGGDARSLTCSGTATGIEVSCVTHTGASFTRFTSSLSTTDSSETGSFTFGAAVTDVYYFSEWGFCTLTDEQGSVVSICVWECGSSTCVSPC